MLRFLVFDTHATCFGGGGKLVTAIDAANAAALAGAKGKTDVSPAWDASRGGELPGVWNVLDERDNALLVVRQGPANVCQKSA